MRALVVVVIPAIPMPSINLPARIANIELRKNPDIPAAVNIKSDTDSTGSLPVLSDRLPIKKPVRAIASDGSVTISEIVASEDSGNASLIRGSAGATAAPPNNMSIADASRNTRVHFVG